MLIRNGGHKVERTWTKTHFPYLTILSRISSFRLNVLCTRHGIGCQLLVFTLSQIKLFPCCDEIRQVFQTSCALSGRFSIVIVMFLIVSSVQRCPFYFTNWKFIGRIFCLVDRNIWHVDLFSMIFRVILADTVPLFAAGGSHCSLAVDLATSRHRFLFSIKAKAQW